ncbi:MAG: nucleoside monophosphate kinase [Patescibacteria group bacterium]|nr:nucleoside monophosphate kinase [Patescibacteria group bacterium]
MKIVFLIGKPACGKDKQADLLVEKLRFKKIVASEELRKFFKKEKGKYFKIGNLKINLDKQRKKINKGKLVAYRLISYLLKKIIFENINKRQSIVFAGSPRSLYEAKMYLKILNNFNNVKYYFIYLKISDLIAIKRALKRGKIEKRLDDNLRTIKNRLSVFRKEILPMIEYLKSKNSLIEINGENSIKKIHQDILKIIK